MNVALASGTKPILPSHEVFISQPTQVYLISLSVITQTTRGDDKATVVHWDFAMLLLVLTSSGFKPSTIANWPFAHSAAFSSEPLTSTLFHQAIVDPHSSPHLKCDFNKLICTQEMPWSLSVTEEKGITASLWSFNLLTEAWNQATLYSRDIIVATINKLLCLSTVTLHSWLPYVFAIQTFFMFVPEADSGYKSPWTFMDFQALSPVAVTAFEWLCSSVLPEVSGEFVTPCKAPLTALPWTPVGLLTCNSDQESRD